MTGCVQLRAQLAVVEYLAVLDHLHVLGAAGQWLIPVLEIDDLFVFGNGDPLLRRIRRTGDVAAAVLVRGLTIPFDLDALDRQDPLLAAERFRSALDDSHRRGTALAGDRHNSAQANNDDSEILTHGKPPNRGWERG